MLNTTDDDFSQINKNNFEAEIPEGSAIDKNYKQGVFMNDQIEKKENESEDLDQQNSRGESRQNEIVGETDESEAFVEEAEGLDLRAFDMLIKDNVETVSKQEIEMIMKFPVSERKIESVLTYNNVLKAGGIGLNYYQLFDRILSKSIYIDAVRIGAVLKNKALLRSILFSVLDAIPKRVGRRNQGFLKRNMMISKINIHNQMKRIVYKYLQNKIKGKDYRLGLISILEVTLLSQLVFFDLINVSELDSKSLLSIKDNLVQNIDFSTIKNQCVTRHIKNIIVSTLQTSSKLSDLVDNGEKDDKSVDFSIIIDNCIRDFDDISDSLLMFDIDFADYDALLSIGRIYRDREIFLQIDDFRMFTEEVIIFVESNKTIFELMLSNLEFNEFMDDLNLYVLNAVKNKFSAKIAIKKERWTFLMTELRNSLLDKNQAITLLTKDQFVDQFSINVLCNREGKPYYSLIRRNFSGNEYARLYETLTQDTDYSLEAVNAMQGDDDALMIVNEKYYSSKDLENMIYSITEFQVRSAENQLMSRARLQLPQYTDFCIHQASLLMPNDIRKLASLFSEKIIKFYEIFCPRVIELIKTWDVQTIGTIRNIPKEYEDLPIYVIPQRNFVEHKDRKFMLMNIPYIYTRMSRRILEQMEDHEGNSTFNIIDNMMKKGRYYVSKIYQKRNMWKDFLVVPDNVLLQFEIDAINTVEGVSLPPMRLKYDMQSIVQPLSGYTQTLLPASSYRTICINYVKSLLHFTNSINNIIHGYNDESIMDVDSIIYKEDGLLAAKALDSQSFTLGFKTNIVNWPSLVTSVNSVFLRSLPYTQANENGRPLCFAESHESVIVELGLPSELDKRNIFNHFKDLMMRRAVRNFSDNFSAFYMSQVKKLYSINNMFKSIVDNSLASIKFNNGKQIINDLLDITSHMNKQLEGEVLGYYARRAILHATIFIDIITSGTGDFKKIINDSQVGELDSIFEMNDSVLATLYNVIDINSRDRVSMDTLISKFAKESNGDYLYPNTLFSIVSGERPYENEIITTVREAGKVQDNFENGTALSTEISDKRNLQK